MGSDTAEPLPTVRALFVPVYATVKVIDVVPDAAAIRACIGGGWLEAVNGHDWHAYLDEEGKLRGLPSNVRATALAWRLGWHAYDDELAGDVVFLGNGPDGDERDVPQHVLDAARDALGLRRPQSGEA